MGHFKVSADPIDPVNATNGTFRVNVSIHVHSISDLDNIRQKFQMDSTVSQYYFLTETAGSETYDYVLSRIPQSALNKSVSDGTWVVVPYPYIEDFWRPELLCMEASSLQLQSVIEKPVTLSMKLIDGALLMKLEQKKRLTIDCAACLKYYPMNACGCRVECFNLINPVDVFWQEREETYANSLWFTGATRLINNFVSLTFCDTRTKRSGRGLCFRVSFSPIVSSIVLSTLLPVVLLVVASIGTSFMSVNSVIERISVSSVLLQSILTLYIQSRLSIPPVPHITVIDVFLLVSAFIVILTILQSVAVRILVQRKALYDLSQLSEATPPLREKCNAAGGSGALRRKSKKSAITTPLVRTFFRYSLKRPPYPAAKFNRNASRALSSFYIIFVPLFWMSAVYVATLPRMPPKPTA
ncbi:gamma-aminobutyric acid receptor subunit beta-4-like [Galendromus occidentalis]|uniref:Gamma-aminobutyric acid receptor subunit beta-4-like n=1 Tax=Galendromus occidentalis TaxID=34638 RepID=A0AAJ7P9U5_9ACAR|nr:gamma-aminobutyric acid receptor subunit beta-4-like [Galendromus occidentalis]